MAELDSKITVKVEMDEELKIAIKSFDERLRRIEQYIQDQEFERIEKYADGLFEGY